MADSSPIKSSAGGSGPALLPRVGRVLPAGFEPAVSALRGRCPGPLDDRRNDYSVVRVPPTGFEPVISTLKGWRPGPLDDGGAVESRDVRAVLIIRFWLRSSGPAETH